MGSNNQKQQQLLNEYKFVVTKNDPAYGEISVYQSKSQYMAVIKLVSTNPQKQCQTIKQLNNQNRDKPKHPNITEIFECFQSSVKDFCGTLDVVVIGVEYIQKSLLKDMEIRKKLRTSYFEGEIWYLMKTICKTLIDLQKRNYIDLHPQNIRITEEGHIKLLDLSVSSHNMSSFKKVRLGLRDIEYLTPEQLLLLKEQSDVSDNLEKINIFILGIIGLVCVTSVEAKSFYNQETNLFLYGQATDSLKSCIQRYKYSPQLEKTLIQLLNYNPFHRPTYNSLLETISNLDASMISDHFYVKCSSQTPRLDSSFSIIKTEQKQQNKLEFTSQSKTQEKNENIITNNTPQTINVSRFLRTKPVIQQYSYTPDSKPRQQEKIQFTCKPKPLAPNYTYYDAHIESALKKSQAVIAQCNNNNSFIQNSQVRQNSSSVQKYAPIVASLNVHYEEQQQNYYNVQQLIQQAKIDNSKQLSKSFTYQ